jgi:hypothetical protein
MLLNVVLTDLSSKYSKSNGARLLWLANGGRLSFFERREMTRQLSLVESSLYSNSGAEHKLVTLLLLELQVVIRIVIQCQTRPEKRREMKSSWVMTERVFPVLRDTIQRDGHGRKWSNAQLARPKHSAHLRSAASSNFLPSALPHSNIRKQAPPLEMPRLDFLIIRRHYILQNQQGRDLRFQF